MNATPDALPAILGLMAQALRDASDVPTQVQKFGDYIRNDAFRTMARALDDEASRMRTEDDPEQCDAWFNSRTWGQLRCLGIKDHDGFHRTASPEGDGLRFPDNMIHHHGETPEAPLPDDAAQTIAAAIQVLEDERNNATPGPWAGIGHAVFSDADRSRVAKVRTIADSHLIDRLYRTIEPQLAFLRDALARVYAEQNTAGIPIHYRYPLDLARAILGDQS